MISEVSSFEFPDGLNPEGTQPSHEEMEELTRERVVQTVEKLLREKKNLLGSGLTAEVHYPVDNTQVCYKIITRRQVHGKNAPHADTVVTYRRDDDEERPPCNTLFTEGKFLSELQGIDPEVCVPRAYLHMSVSSEDEGETYIVNNEVAVLSMERLNAVSIRDVLEGRAQIPHTFKEEEFFKKLERFIQSMNEKGFFHRDLHAGNIMIDLETGNPRVIDFGDATYGREEDAYEQEYTRKGKAKIWRYPHKDVDFMKIVQKELQEHLS